MEKSNFHNAIIVAFILVTSSLARAGEIKPYSADVFKSKKDSAETMVLDFHADWCSTCKAQAAALKSLQHEPEFKNIIVLQVNFDEEKSLKKNLGVNKQSTLIVYRKGHEIARATGVTDRNEILKLVTREN